ncbi:alcohol dehydrogenase [Desulfomicrobium apsheronum]|uniref:Alcohol dehydrogenase n=1 Tax=Desulfomicrobium apsheronum TaxID=52560 RepID=A0A1I3NEZ8_9BACT|nr:iron-containing alcohol dehydrogenase [Desulfomicrobium apsheronum]MDY0226507.1 iron-containing alcohol dehydrogenase [Desulfomicrobium apsheronum]SFJ07356.1 alcohol dehydrogenase [Desulfomicrobium apsheronum]
MDIRKFSLPEIIFGHGSMEYTGSYALQLGAKKVFVVSDPGLERSGWVGKLIEVLEASALKWVYYSNVSSNPRDYEVHLGADLYKAEGADVVIGLGGGSPLDMAKGVATVASNGGTIQDYEGANLIIRPLPPMIFLPSTAGSGSDISQFAIITDVARKVKMSLISRSLTPNVSIIDPDMLSTADDDLIVTSAVDALSHAVESYVSLIAHTLTETQAVKAMNLILDNLKPALKTRDPLALENLSMAAVAAGMSFSNASLGACHAIAHSLGGFFDTTHGMVHPVLLPAVMSYNLPACEAKMATIGEIVLGKRMSSSLQTAEGGIKRLKEIFLELGTSVHFREIVDDETAFPQICEMATKDACLLTNPRPATAEELLCICQEVW